MRFRQIDTVFLFGGQGVLAEVATRLKRTARVAVCVYTCPRQLEERLSAGGETLRDRLETAGLNYVSTTDINAAPGFREKITPASLGLGFGQAWSFDSDILARFDGQLLDFMGIRLPQYRGGAHYSWQILRGNRIGASNIQLIDERTVQGVSDSGIVIKSREYLFPVQARVPLDYYHFVETQDVAFVADFFAELMEGREFQPRQLQEEFTLHFPRLNTTRQGFIDWSWSTGDIERFICAFDEPYAGASTFLEGRRVRLRSCRVETNDGPFHPFQAGLIHKLSAGHVYVASLNGTLIVESLTDEAGNDLIPALALGQRLHTPRSVLDEALAYSAEYTAKGSKG